MFHHELEAAIGVHLIDFQSLPPDGALVLIVLWVQFREVNHSLFGFVVDVEVVELVIDLGFSLDFLCTRLKQHHVERVAWQVIWQALELVEVPQTNLRRLGDGLTHDANLSFERGAQDESVDVVGGRDHGTYDHAHFARIHDVRKVLELRYL